jgi:hypothetical protein
MVLNRTELFLDVFTLNYNLESVSIINCSSRADERIAGRQKCSFGLTAINETRNGIAFFIDCLHLIRSLFYSPYNQPAGNAGGAGIS